jgi:hypothetical protein
MMCVRLPNGRSCEHFSFQRNYVASIGRYPGSDQLAEIFIGNSKGGSHSDAAAKDAAVVASLALQLVLQLLPECFDRPQHIGGDLQYQYEQSIRSNRRGHGAASSTIEALMYSLQARRTAALKEPDTRHRLAQLNEDQLVEVASRLQKLKPNIAQAWADQEIAELVIARSQC